MAVFKKISPQDISIIPFNVHKDYTINSTNYTGSCSYGVNIMSANFYSHSFGEPIRGIHIKREEKNPNGVYKASAYDSIKHLYYSRIDKPSENFGSNLPERSDRQLWDKAHVISIPSPLYDLKIKSGSFRFTDDYFRSMILDRNKYISESIHTYQTPPLLANRYLFETSQSRFDDSVSGLDISHARGPSVFSQINILSGSIGAAKVGTGSILFRVGGVDTIAGKQYNAGHGLQLRQAGQFIGTLNDDWWEETQCTHASNVKHGMPEYTVTMWVKPPDWNKMPNNVTGAPGQSTILTRDKNSYFELNMLTSSMSESALNPKGLVPLQMFWGATGSNCTTNVASDAVGEGFGLATGSWNLVTVQQQFWPDAFMGTSGSILKSRNEAF